MSTAKRKRHSPSVTEPTLRYAAKLLFQSRIVRGGKSNKRRLCEERIIVFNAEDAESALREAKRRGRAAQHRYKNCYGDSVMVEFVGIVELKYLGPERDDGEVWYEFSERMQPMERRKQLIPPSNKLTAIVNDPF